MKPALKKLLPAVAAVLIAATSKTLALQIPDNVPSWKKIPPQTLASLLRQGELVAVDRINGGKVEMISIGMLADSPPEKIWNVITDFEGYTNLLPDSLKTTLISRKGNTAVVRFAVSVLKISIVNITTDYTLKYTLAPPKRADISWVEGDVKNVDGFWELHPVNNGAKTVVIYAITSDLGSANPLVGAFLAEQPETTMAVNLSSAIIFTRKIMEKATGTQRPSAPRGSQPIWKTLDEATLHKLLSGGRVGFISRIGASEIAAAGVLVRKKRNFVWNTLTDFERYPEKIEQITRSEILERNEKSARVRMSTNIISLGPIKIASDETSIYYFDKPSKMWCEDENAAVKNDDIINRWLLTPLAGGAQTALFNELTTDISSMGTIANFMLKRIPSLQIAVDLSMTMILTNEIKKWAESE
ncbi:MAG: SRPBCC family protein [bacterium]